MKKRIWYIVKNDLYGSLTRVAEGMNKRVAEIKLNKLRKGNDEKGVIYWVDFDWC